MRTPTSIAFAGLLAMQSVGPAAGQGAPPPGCLEVQSQALGRPGWERLRLEGAATAADGPLHWRSPDRVTLRGRWRREADTLVLEVASTQRLAGARGALDPRGSTFRAALVPSGPEWSGTGRQTVPGVWRGPVAEVRARRCGHTDEEPGAPRLLGSRRGDRASGLPPLR